MGSEVQATSYLSGFTKPLVSNAPDAELWGPIVVPNPVPATPNLAPSTVIPNKDTTVSIHIDKKCLVISIMMVS